MYKLIALDMDGTLLNSQGQISPRTHAAIAAARAKGVTVVLASGRPLEGMSRYLVELGLTGQDDYVICYNGALVQQVADQRIIRSQLLTQPRTKEGNFWHKDIYPWQVWLDGTYMAQPFYMEYETRFNKMQGCIDSYKQFMNIQKHMRDEKTGLYYHGYDESRQMYWADPVTGCSPNFWLRAMGWFMVAMVDVLERMDEQLYNEYRGIMAMFKQTIEDVHKFQDEETGMFWQVMDHPGVEGNYLETSGTALFAYAVLKGVRLGYLPKRMAAWAEKAFYGTCDRYLSKNPDGSLQLDGICLVAGLGGKDHRDGSLAYYFSEPVVCNDAKGVGPLVLAYTEMIARK